MIVKTLKKIQNTSWKSRHLQEVKHLIKVKIIKAHNKSQKSQNKKTLNESKTHYLTLNDSQNTLFNT